VVRAAQYAIGEDKVKQVGHPKLFGEDFAYYLQECEGAFFMLGSANENSTATAPLHSPLFNPDEHCIVVGASVMSTIALQDQL
jgi:metal-dependent amidase/aminoacylase/carboxypeptidase family protein